MRTRHVLVTSSILALLTAGCATPQETAASAPIVEIDGMTFTPSLLTVAAGTVVSFRNDDSTAHQPAFDGATLNTPAGTTAQRTFDSPGDHRYSCRLHPEMQGTIRVE